MKRREIRQLLSSFVVNTPCKQNWNEMTGDDKVRLCSQCNLNVHNVSAMTDFKAATILKRRQTERVCVFAYQREDGSVITDNCPMQLRIIRAKLRTTVAISVITFCYAAVLSAQASGGLAGAPVDPQYGGSTDVSFLADIGYDTARDIARLLTLNTTAIVFYCPLAKRRSTVLENYCLKH